jgi:hypothetical protein
MLDERMEQLINRKLDGELTEAESLELDKLLIRSPEGRALLEEQEQLDRLASDSLRTALGGGLANRLVSGQTPLDWPSRSSRREHLWYGSIGLAAGFVLAMLASSLVAPLWNGRQKDATPPIVSNAPGGDAGPALVDAEQNHDWPPRAQDVTSQRERTPEQVLGVYDDDSRSLYLLEMNRAPVRVTPAHMDY